MTHSFHMLTTGVPCGKSLYPCSGSLLCTDMDSIQSKQDAQSLIFPLICFQNKPSQTSRFWITEGTTDLHAWSATVVESSTDQITVPEDLGWVTFMVRLMRSGSEQCSQFGDKTKPQMSLTPSVDYFHWLSLSESWDPEILTQNLSLFMLRLRALL